MKKPLLVLLLSFAIGLVIVNQSISHTNSAPTLDCVQCHSGDFASDVVKIEGLPKSYKPSQTYRLTVVVKSNLKSQSDVKGGFALTASKGTLIITDNKNTQLLDGFVTHTIEGIKLSKWSFSWKAPAEPAEVTFTVMALAANGDFSSAGDQVGATTYTIKSSK